MKLLKGFTLIEVLIVVAVIGVLTFLFIPKNDNDANIRKMQASAKSIETALASYSLDSGSYPEKSTFDPSNPDFADTINIIKDELGKRGYDKESAYADLVAKNAFKSIDENKIRKYLRAAPNNLKDFIYIDDSKLNGFVFKIKADKDQNGMVYSGDYQMPLSSLLPLTPTHFIANNVTGSSVDLSWDAVSGATSYTVKKMEPLYIQGLLQPIQPVV
ncbi:hypothetical protein BIV60_11425 [Bacillus sp. MUM 116]|uniref:type II secretion system protein n=1 Tax=Bacillus sp. MUM 116 TaxID=1678002 RepID=UPI0008F5BCEE|nr:prepilin-type N-terminal cleavage/methylation domain-containing protein [Bacillus sp. MUM 116]OIK14570.1 hypothetical protein BIV60_11425 [Bacillus sp. MUM 116]